CLLSIIYYLLSIVYYLLPANRNTSSAITSSASRIASFRKFRDNASACCSSSNNATAVSINLCGASESGTIRAASLLTNAFAFFVWWSSATFGDGTSTVGLATTQSSAMVPAPALAMITSAAA